MSANEVKNIHKRWILTEPLPGDGKIEAIYLHVPFCLRKCGYCDFYSLANAPETAMESYVQAVLQEAGAWAEKLSASQMAIRTVFFGGGTPTALPPRLMRRLLSQLRKALPLEHVDEWTVEANPATVDGDYCRLLLSEGVTRLSLGVQSFDDAELQALGRVHSAADAIATLDAARDAGFARLSIDLIYGIPSQTLEAWRRNLQQALRLGLNHVSAYCLSYEEGTPLQRQLHQQRLAKASEAEELALMRLSREVLAEGGLQRYEVSNYALPGEECRHNLTYWRGGNYLGLGPAAASHLEGCRWSTPKDLNIWQEIALAKTASAESFERLSSQQRASELAMLMLRMSEGLRYDKFAARLRQNAQVMFAEAFQRLEKAGLIRLNSEAAVLTDRGMEIADMVVSDCFI